MFSGTLSICVNASVIVIHYWDIMQVQNAEYVNLITLLYVYSTSKCNVRCPSVGGVICSGHGSCSNGIYGTGLCKHLHNCLLVLVVQMWVGGAEWIALWK